LKSSPATPSRNPPRIPKHASVAATHNLVGIQAAFPEKDSPAIGAALSDYLPETDFNGSLRGDSKDAGAYK
jgi:hypothetical protein